MYWENKCGSPKNKGNIVIFSQKLAPEGNIDSSSKVREVGIISQTTWGGCICQKPQGRSVKFSLVFLFLLQHWRGQLDRYRYTRSPSGYTPKWIWVCNITFENFAYLYHAEVIFAHNEPCISGNRQMPMDLQSLLSS